MVNDIQTSQDRRSAALEALRGERFDVLVIGGGIVGAGVARDAAMRGLRTALVEQRDFAGGTSSRSSRLLHGGIRYLAQLRLGLVREASREKAVIARIAPHLAEPLPFLFPTRRGTPWSWWKLSTGVRVYDLLCGLKNFGRSSSLGVEETLKLLPGLSTTNLSGAVRYFDALTSDARLVIDTLRSAERHGATVINDMRLFDVAPEAAPEGDAWRASVEDADASGAFDVTARTIVNAAGPWSDRIPQSGTTLRVTKGVHLVVHRRRFNVPEAVVMAEGDRLLFAIPWGERVILGTTDTDYQGDLAEPPCDAADVAYVLETVNATFPTAGLTPDDVVSFWSGLRPLVADPHGSPSDISRRHEITMSNVGWWDVTGGKLTTYRQMAEETVDAIGKHLGKRAPCSTAVEPLLPPDGEHPPRFGVIPPPVSAAAVEQACRREWARRLDDVMLRRTSWRHYYPDHLTIAAEVAEWMAALLGWNEQRVQSELERYSGLTRLAGGSGQ
jgi:glycerol-3-phosphate dehydrogenase